MAEKSLPQSSSPRFGTVVARLTGTNLLIVVAGFITSPILARALGPSGRGEVAAVFAVVTIAPWVGELGLTAFLSREHARGSRPLGVLLGSTMPIVLASSLVGVALAVPLAHLLGRGRPVVVEFLEIGLYLLPIAAGVQLLIGVAVGAERWSRIMTARLISVVGTCVAVVTLSLLGALTVKSVAISYVAISVVSNLPLLASLRGSRPWRFEPSTAREGFSFGIRSWLSTIAALGNNNLDQVLMAGLVGSRELGLYALAVTLSTTTNSLIGAISNALVPRLAIGDSHLAARACRVTLAIAALVGSAIALTSPVVVPLVFGDAFRPAIPMLVILLAASLFSVPALVLGAGLIAAGQPAATARAQLAGVIVTVPALVAVLPTYGGIGAACVSLFAYYVTFAVVLRASTETFGLPARTLLVITAEDVEWLRSRVPRARGRAHAAPGTS